MPKYEPKQIEPKWQKIWAETGIYRAADAGSRPKYYMLTEFPYPSGEGLHAGHIREYTIGDVISRHKRMQGFNVLYPMGYDAFGLPTENFAIKNKIAPQKATAQNVANFRNQFDSMGYGIDWDREVNTTDPDYYKWTQWLFLQFFKAGLAYQAEIPINWCPKEKTGLANEEVVDGKHERCGTQVEKKLLKQWMLRITDYADRLIEGLKTVDYPARIADQQINWIGASRGAEIDFAVGKAKVTVYTTRADTLGGATFLVLAPEHPLVAKITTSEQKSKVEAYIKKVQSETELDRQAEERPKTGEWTGAYATNPLNDEKIPVWIADYVLMSYGTGAIMAVPAHDQRDHDFATKFGLPIKPVIEPVTGSPQADPEFRRSIVALVRDPKNHKLLSINWGEHHGGNIFIGGGREEGEDVIETAKREVAEETGYTDLKYSGQTQTVHHHYFAHSKNKARQIEAVGVFFELASDRQVKPKPEADEAGKFSVEWLTEDQADSKVQDDLHRFVFETFIKHHAYQGEGPLTNTGKSFDGLSGMAAKRAIIEHLHKQGKAKGATKYRLRDWIFSRQHYWGEPIPIIHCSKCGAVAVPDDQLPVELPAVEHYEPTETGESPLAAIPDWVNVKCPDCGGPAKRETDTMPNWAGSSWYYLRYMDPHNDKAFAAPDKLKYWGMVDLYLGGMEHTTLHLLYSRFWHQFLYDQKLVPTAEPYAARRGQGIVLAADGRKMSKSLGNVVNPTDIIAGYGADTLRLYMLFMAPYDETTAWSDERLAGVSRFLYRVWNVAQSLIAAKPGQPAAGSSGTFALDVDRMTHRTLKKVHDDLEEMKFNTAVAALMEYANFLGTSAKLDRIAADFELAQRTAQNLLLLLAPFVPHIAEELWEQAGQTESIHLAPWPKYDPELLKQELVEVVIQVNGKVRGTVTLPADAPEGQAAELAKVQPAVAKHLDGKDIVKTIEVPRRLVNFVVK